MRRTKKKSKVVKVLTTAAIVTALSTGSLTAFAAPTIDADYIQVGAGPGSTRISITDFQADAAYRQKVMDAFHNADLVFVREAGSEEWNEMSATATAGDFFTDAELIPEWDPYQD